MFSFNAITMNNLLPKKIVWLLPPAYLAHIFEEYFSGKGFPLWFSSVFKVDLSNADFVIINSVGFAATVAIVILYNIDKLNNFVIAVLGTLFLVNGIIHLLASLFSASYSPGTITGVIIYLPLGYLIYKKIFLLIPEDQRILSIATGIIIQAVVAVIAMSI
jgi:Protein of unknown function with HXXEE motif